MNSTPPELRTFSEQKTPGSPTTIYKGWLRTTKFQSKVFIVIQKESTFLQWWLTSRVNIIRNPVGPNTYIQTVPYTIFICTMYIIVQTFDFVKTHSKPNRFIYLYQVNILVENPKSSVMMPSNVVNYPRYTIPSGKGSHDWMKNPPNFQIRKIHLHFYPFYPLVIFPERMFFLFVFS